MLFRSELFDDQFDPGPRLTLEAVKLYADRVTPDGMVALHISNKYFWIEPVVAQIAKELNLHGQVWHDDGERRPGKVASSWVVLVRDKSVLDLFAKPPDSGPESKFFRPLKLEVGVKVRRDADGAWPAELKIPSSARTKD